VENLRLTLIHHRTVNSTKIPAMNLAKVFKLNTLAKAVQSMKKGGYHYPFLPEANDISNT